MLVTIVFCLFGPATTDVVAAGAALAHESSPVLEEEEAVFEEEEAVFDDETVTPPVILPEIEHRSWLVAPPLALIALLAGNSAARRRSADPGRDRAGSAARPARN